MTVCAALRRSALVAIAAVAPLATWMLLIPVDEGNYLATGVVGGAASLSLWLLVLRCSAHPLWPEVQRALDAAGCRLGRE